MRRWSPGSKDSSHPCSVFPPGSQQLEEGLNERAGSLLRLHEVQLLVAWRSALCVGPGRSCKEASPTSGTAALWGLKGSLIYLGPGSWQPMSPGFFLYGIHLEPGRVPSRQSWGRRNKAWWSVPGWVTTCNTHARSQGHTHAHRNRCTCSCTHMHVHTHQHAHKRVDIYRHVHGLTPTWHATPSILNPGATISSVKGHTACKLQGCKVHTQAIRSRSCYNASARGFWMGSSDFLLPIGILWFHGFNHYLWPSIF